MLDRGVLRIGGAAAMIGAVLSLVFNLLHPRSTEALESAEGELQMVADSGIWAFDHYMLAWAVAFVFIGLIGIGWSFEDGAPATWARFALASAIGSVGVAYITLAIDGMVLGRIAEDWAANPDDPQIAGSAVAVAEISLGLFTATIGSLFGITPILYGITFLSSARFASWLGYLAILAGALGLASASINFHTGPTTFSVNVLFMISSIAGIVWLFMAGLQVWRGVGETPPASEVRQPVAA